MDDILSTGAFQGAELRSRLLSYLFKYRQRFVPSHEIIEKVFLIDVSYLKSDERVRERCGDLRRALENFILMTETDLVCSLPDAISGKGYKLEFRRRDATDSCSAFWRPHFSDGLVYIVYVEQLFYQDWSRRFLFRHPELNAESGQTALEELKARYPKEFSDEINASYPYVAYGEIGARDTLMRWFARSGFVVAKTAVTRRMDDTEVWSSSSVLFGEARSNSMIKDVFKHCVPLDMHLEVTAVAGKQRGRAHFPITSASERLQISPIKLSRARDRYTVDYDPKEGSVLLLLTRIRNRQSGKIVTIFNSEFARSIEQMALILTDPDRLTSQLTEIGWQNGLPTEFQILFSFIFDSIPTAHRMATPQIIAWKSYDS